VTIKQLEDLNVAGRRVLVRADFNVPFAKGDGPRVITDDGRIRAALPTINYLVEQGAKVILTAHLGRPKAGPTPELSLEPVAVRLSELLGRPVAFAADITGDSAKRIVAGLQNGDVALLENVRFDPRDQSKVADERTAMANELAVFADVFVSDGFNERALLFRTDVDGTFVHCISSGRPALRPCPVSWPWWTRPRGTLL